MKKIYILYFVLYCLLYLVISLLISYGMSHFLNMEFKWWNKLAISLTSLYIIYQMLKKNKLIK